MKTLILFDLDGVLADDRHRKHFYLNEQYAEYFAPENMLADPVLAEGRSLMDLFYDLHYPIAYLTGRREERREVTERWLLDNDLPLGDGIVLMMKTPEFYGVSLGEFKRDKVALLRASYDVDTLLIDDDPNVIEAQHEAFGALSATLATWCPKDARAVALAQA